MPEAPARASLTVLDRLSASRSALKSGFPSVLFTVCSAGVLSPKLTARSKLKVVQGRYAAQRRYAQLDLCAPSAERDGEHAGRLVRLVRALELDDASDVGRREREESDHGSDSRETH